MDRAGYEWSGKALNTSLLILEPCTADEMDFDGNSGSIPDNKIPYDASNHRERNIACWFDNAPGR